MQEKVMPHLLAVTNAYRNVRLGSSVGGATARTGHMSDSYRNTVTLQIWPPKTNLASDVEIFHSYGSPSQTTRSMMVPIQT